MRRRYNRRLWWMMLFPAAAGMGILAGTAMAPPEFEAADSEGVEFAEYSGTVRLPDPSNWWTGSKMTDEACSVQFYFTDHRTAMVRSTLWADITTEFHAVRVKPPSREFYFGDLPEGRLAILQFWERQPVTLTLTTYDEDGEPNYGVSGSGDMLAECEFPQGDDRPPG